MAFRQQYVALCLKLYLEGMGFRAIERVVSVSHVSVINWVKKYGKALTHAVEQQRKKLSAVELDELCSYVGSSPLRGDRLLKYCIHGHILMQNRVVKNTRTHEFQLQTLQKISPLCWVNHLIKHKPICLKPCLPISLIHNTHATY